MFDKKLDKLAKYLYDEYSGNHPTIHCNRFANWEELSNRDKFEWYEKANKILNED